MKRLTTFLSIFSIAATAFAFTLVGCDKQDRGGTGKIRVKMTDAPINFDSVNVEIETVMVHVSDTGNGTEGWVELSTNSGIYNLLDLQNDITTVLVDTNVLPVGDIQQMRLILGDNNWVVVDSVMYPLEMSSQTNTGLKFNVDATIAPNDLVEILIDFDAGQSIVQTGQGTYKLKPVIKVEEVLYL